MKILIFMLLSSLSLNCLGSETRDFFWWDSMAQQTQEVDWQSITNIVLQPSIGRCLENMSTEPGTTKKYGMNIDNVISTQSTDGKKTEYLILGNKWIGDMFAGPWAMRVTTEWVAESSTYSCEVIEIVPPKS